MDDDKKFSYFLLGLGVGVAVGVLFAPKAGSETRLLLREKAEEGKEFLKRTGEELKETATDLVDRGKQAIAQQKEQFSAAVEAGKSAYRERVVVADAPAADAVEDLMEGV